VLINDSRWPSLREAARRFLREENCPLSVPIEHEDDAWNLVQLISDYIPEKLTLPNVIIGKLGGGEYFQMGDKEPPEHVCWVPNATWNDFKTQVVELLEAGYPGCVGCGGPGSEGVWNEALRRLEIAKK